MNITRSTMAHGLCWLLILYWLVPGHAFAGSPEAKRLVVNGIEMPYEDQGGGVPVVFVHGAFSDSRNWEPQREAIAAKFRFIAVTPNTTCRNASPCRRDGRYMHHRVPARSYISFR